MITKILIRDMVFLPYIRLRARIRVLLLYREPLDGDKWVRRKFVLGIKKRRGARP
jgi:hypothetical protein